MKINFLKFLYIFLLAGIPFGIIFGAVFAFFILPDALPFSGNFIDFQMSIQLLIITSVLSGPLFGAGMAFSFGVESKIKIIVYDQDAFKKILLIKCEEFGYCTLNSDYPIIFKNKPQLFPPLLVKTALKVENNKENVFFLSGPIGIIHFLKSDLRKYKKFFEVVKI